MTTFATTPELQALLPKSDQADVIFPAVLAFLGAQLQCDRCFLYLRHPATRLGKVPYCWRRHDNIPIILDDHWKPEPANLPNADPMFAAALQCAPAIFVEDVETTSPDILDRTFEQENFGHRALVHAHLCHEGQLWGVLQPCVFDQPRHWTTSDRDLITTATAALLPFAIAYIQAES